MAGIFMGRPEFAVPPLEHLFYEMARFLVVVLGRF
jgi:hypothetical protein